LIRIRGLSLKVGEFCLREVDLEVARQEYFVVLGPTGAGKTLLIECLAGLLRPQEGQIWIDDQEVTGLRPEARRVGYLPQDYALFPHLTVKENIAFGLRIRKASASAAQRKVAELAGLLGIGDLLERDVLHLSGGERQRTALARALAIQPTVLLLDEPLSALDEQTRESLCGELRRVHQEFGTTTVHISHSFEETLAVADRIAILHAGRLQQVGPPSQVMSHPASEFVAAFVRCQNVLQGHASQQGESACIRIGEARFYSTSPAHGSVSVVIRPEDIALSTLPPIKKSPNLFRGKVRFIIDRGALMRVDVATETQLHGSDEVPAEAHFTVLCTRQQREALALAPGKEAYLSFDPSVVHIISRNDIAGNE